MNEWVIFGIIGLATYLIRLSAIAVVARRHGQGATIEMQPATEATLRLIGPAVFAAIVADRLLVGDGAIDYRWTWLVAAIVCGAVAWRWRSAAITMGVGMAVVWTLEAVF